MLSLNINNISLTDALLVDNEGPQTLARVHKEATPTIAQPLNTTQDDSIVNTPP
jgi:hypothetical protein